MQSGARFSRLTDDERGELVSAGAVLVPDLTDEGGVDGVVHLPHRQPVVVNLHRVWQPARSPGEEGGKTKIISEQEKCFLSIS